MEITSFGPRFSTECLHCGATVDAATLSYRAAAPNSGNALSCRLTQFLTSLPGTNYDCVVGY